MMGKLIDVENLDKLESVAMNESWGDLADLVWSYKAALHALWGVSYCMGWSLQFFQEAYQFDDDLKREWETPIKFAEAMGRILHDYTEPMFAAAKEFAFSRGGEFAHEFESLKRKDGEER